jgi:hypothetical protein
VAGPLRSIGFGPAFVEVVDLQDVPITAELEQSTSDSDHPGDFQSMALASLDVRTFATGGSGRYELTIKDAAGNPFDTCTMTVGSGEQYRFVVLKDTVAVRRLGPAPSAGTELTTDVSSLCLGT